jgi:hypothetical protein
VPGGRLTPEDRSRIAELLADGLGYAEIGRRLGRPTSTISREVARNGPAGEYLAGPAQEAAARRARRRGPGRAGTAGGSEPPEAVREFTGRFAGLLAATGMPRMTARVFVCLLTAEGNGLTAAGLTGRLGVSPASVSKSVGALEALRLVSRAPDPGTRRERYLIDEDVWLRAWRSDTGAHGEVAAAAREGVAVFGAGTPAGARLGATGRFFARIGAEMGGSTLAEPAAGDGLTVIAALAHAARPLTAGALGAALGWPPDRTAAAVAEVRRRPALAYPLTLVSGTGGTYTLDARPDLLSPAQRAALGAAG